MGALTVGPSHGLVAGVEGGKTMLETVLEVVVVLVILSIGGGAILGDMGR